MRIRHLLALLLAAAGPALAEEPRAHGHDRHAGHASSHGNPADLDRYIAALADPARDAWQKPDALLAALALKPGEVACDVGAGPGYFALRLARLVGPSGRVFAVDVEPRMLVALLERLAAAGARNVTPVLSLPDDPLLPPAACDLVLVVDTYHHFPDGRAYLRRLVGSLRPGGRIVNVDFHKRETPAGPPLARRVSREDFLADAAAAGLAVAREHDLLPWQYALELRPR